MNVDEHWGAIVNELAALEEPKSWFVSLIAIYVSVCLSTHHDTAVEITRPFENINSSTSITYVYI
jgi:hypothetical protein